MFQFPGFASQGLCIQPRDDISSRCRVAPFGNPRIKAYLQLPVAYRSLSRPSSPAHAKASTMRPYLLKPLGFLHKSGLQKLVAQFLALVCARCTVSRRIEIQLYLHTARFQLANIIMSKNVFLSSSDKNNVELAGFEPATPCLQSRCSTN